MPHFLVSCIAAFAVTVSSIYFLKPIAFKIGLVDSPGGRKKHVGEVPLLGGIAMLTGLLFAILTLPISLQMYRAFLAACGVLVFIGLLDDFHELSARVKLIMQVFVAVLMTAWGGNTIHVLGDLFSWGNIYLGEWSIPFTVFAVVGVINIVNMMDGLDGLAGGSSFVELIFMLVIALITHQHDDALMIALVLTVLFAFLCFNFPFPGRQKASIFMGDAGSMWLGFVLGWYAVSLTRPLGLVTPVTMLWILALPLFDGTSLIINRCLRGRSPLAADRRHLHHILLFYGFSKRMTTYLLLIISIIFGSIGFFSFYYHIPEYLMFISFLTAFIVYYLLLSWAWIKFTKLSSKS